MKPYSSSNVPNAPKKPKATQSRLRSGMRQIATTPSSDTKDWTTPKTYRKPTKKTTTFTSSKKNNMPNNTILASVVLKDVNQILDMVNDLVSSCTMACKTIASTDVRCNLNDTCFKMMSQITEEKKQKLRKMKIWREWREEQSRSIREPHLHGKRHMKTCLAARLDFFCPKIDINSRMQCVIHNTLDNANAKCSQYQIGFRVHNVGSLICLRFSNHLENDQTVIQQLFMNLCQVYFCKLARGKHTPKKVRMHRFLTEASAISFNDKDWIWIDKVTSFMQHSLIATANNEIDSTKQDFYTWDSLNIDPSIRVIDDDESVPIYKTHDMTRISLYKCDTVICEHQFAKISDEV